MKKFFTLMAVALISMNAFAQEEEDVTGFITNAGFDQDLTWQVDGSPKAAVAQDYSLSSRSKAWVAEDNSVYCLGQGTRSDGYAPAWNGFVGQIDGWVVKTGSTYYPFGSASPEWVYFGSVAYGLGETAVPIADDGTTFLAVPEKPAEDSGEDNVAALYLRAGWGGSAAYQQTVKLPCAQYRLDYWIYNANYASSKSNTGVVNLCKVTCRKDVFEDSEGFNAEEWTKHSIEFTPTTDFTIQFGFTSSGGSGSNPFLFIDGIKLYRIGEADEAELVQADLMELVDSLDYLMNDQFASYDGFTNELSDALLEYQGAADSGDLEEMKPALENIKVYLESLNATLEDIDAFNELLLEAENLITKTESNPYPGIDAFVATYDQSADYAENGFVSGDETVSAADYLAVMTEALAKAINDYKFSQEATPENPADYSFLIQNPEFLNEDAEPTYDDDLNPTYPNIDSYTQGTAPSDGNSTGWNIGSSGGDQRLNFVQGRACWNAWRNTASFDEVRLYQNLTDLPNGYYTASALVITQEGCISDQHVYATSDIDSQVSPVLSKDTWTSSNSGESTEWDFLTTEKVLVNNGNLTIGVIGHGTDVIPGSYSDYRQGWFCATHFVLKYYGPAGEEAIFTIYNNKINECTTYATGMGFAADKAAFEEVLAANSNAQSAEEINVALANINAAYETAQASQSEYNGEVTGTYAGLQDSIANAYPENCKLVAQPIVDLMSAFLVSAEATYTDGAAKTPILRYYRDNLLPVLKECESKVYTSQVAQQILADAIKQVVDELSVITEFPTTDVLAQYVAILNNAVAVCDAEEEYETKGVKDGDDYTSAIENPTIETSSNTSVPSGWTIEMSGSGNGYYTNSGQEYNGGSGHYLDAWNGTAGLLLYNAYQVLENIPNGLYRLTAMVRNSSNNGYYLYAEPDQDKAQIVLNPVALQELNYTKYYDSTATSEAGGDSISYVSDNHGAIWQAAVDKLAAVKGITGPVMTDEGAYSVASQIYDAYEGDETMVPEEYLDDFKTVAANSLAGRGWQYKSVEFTVTNHSAIIGVVTDSTFTEGCKDINGDDCVPYDGTWMSADNFTLTIVTVGDNTGWSPATGIDAVNNEKATIITNRKYNLAGQVVGDNFKGIIISGGKKYLQK